MKIAKIELENFLSFEKISLDLSENLNIILGKNESGKSNFLKALKVFNSENLNYQNIANRNNYLDKKDVIIKIFFEINDAEKQSLENKIEKDNPGIECIFGNFFYFEKIISHDNKIKLNSNFLTNWSFDILDKKILKEKEIEFLEAEQEINGELQEIKKIKDAGIKIDILFNVFKDKYNDYDDLEELSLDEFDDENLIEIEDIINNIKDMDILYESEKINYAIENIKLKFYEKIKYLEENIEKKEVLKKEFESKEFLIKPEYVYKLAWNILDFKFVSWEYKKEYLLDKKISIKEFNLDRKSTSIPLSNIFKNIEKEKKIDFNKLIDMANSEMPRDQEMLKQFVNSFLNEKFKKNWNSKNIDIELFKNINFIFNISGDYFTITLKEESNDEDFNNYSHFNDRSDGFKRMASILLSLEQNSPNNILLIDEVETHIHIDGQIKLFDFLSSFSEKNQIIFSTISPFMINSNPNINYLIFDKDEKHYSKAENKKYLEPNGISKIYGVNIYEYFLNPKKIVIFEGKIDREFFEYILTKNNFDFTDIRFLEANGASKIPAEIEWIISTNKKLEKIISIVDNDKAGLSAIENIEYKYKGNDSKVSSFKISNILGDDSFKILEDIYPKKLIYDYLDKNDIKRKDFSSFIKIINDGVDGKKIKSEFLNTLKNESFNDENFLKDDENCKKIYEWFVEKILK